MRCPICRGEIAWDCAWKFYECYSCNRRWLDWPPPNAVRIMLGFKSHPDEWWHEFWRVFPNGAWT